MSPDTHTEPTTDASADDTALCIPAALKARLEALAERMDQPVDELITTAPTDFAAWLEQDQGELDAALADADAGRVVPHEVAMAELNTRVEETILKRDECCVPSSGR